MEIAANLKHFPEILEAFEFISEDQSQKGEARREANNIADNMQEIEFVFMLNFWNEILLNFHRVRKVLQNEDVNLKTCADLYVSLASRDEFEKYEKKMQRKCYQMLITRQLQLTNISERRYPTTEIHQKHIRMPEINFLSTPFTQLLTNLQLI